jgi:hypothetical protein
VIRNFNQSVFFLLRVLNFGHGKSYDPSSTLKYIRHQLNHHIYNENNEVAKCSQLNTRVDECIMPSFIDIDMINNTLAKHCKKLTHLGIFYRQAELKFKRDPLIK